jgi:RNA polymerase sigma factor (sigma-70 family)
MTLRRPTAEHDLSVPAGKGRAADPETPADLASLLLALRPQLRRIFYTYRIPIEDTEDLLQEATLVVLRRWADVRDKPSFLIGTVRRLSYVYRRKARHAPLLVALEAPLLDLLPASGNQTDAQLDMRLDLEALLRRLSRRQRTAIQLWRAGLSCSEAAAVLGLHKQVVCRATQSGLQRLQHLMRWQPFLRRSPG